MFLTNRKLSTFIHDLYLSNWRCIAVGAVEAKLDSLDLSILGAIAGTADAIEVAVGDLDADVASVEGKLDTSLDATVSSRATQASVDDIESQLEELEDQFSELALLEDIDDLEEDVFAIEGKLDVSLDATVHLPSYPGER